MLSKNEIAQCYEALSNEENYKKTEKLTLLLMKAVKRPFDIQKCECRIHFNPGRLKGFSAIRNLEIPFHCYFEVQIIKRKIESEDTDYYKKCFATIFKSLLEVKYFDYEN